MTHENILDSAESRKGFMKPVVKSQEVRTAHHTKSVPKEQFIKVKHKTVKKGN